MINDVAKKMIDAIKTVDQSKTAGYDTAATVRRIEGDTAWVHIKGGVDETPVKLTIAATEGDNVQVRVVGGRAFIVGNASSPPTDDTTAIISKQIATEAKSTADMAIEDADRAKEAADIAEVSAGEAKASAQQAITDAATAGRAASVAQTAAEAAQATADTKKTVFITQPTPPYHVGDLWAKLGEDLQDMITSAGDNLIDSAGDLFQAAILTEGTIYVCTVPKLAGQTFAESDWELATADEGLREWFWHDADGAHVLGDETGFRNDITSTGMKIVDTTTETSVAEFGSNGARIGQTDESYIVQDYHSLQMIDKEGWTYVHIGDMRNREGNASVTDRFYVKTGEDTYYLSFPSIDTDYTVTISGYTGTITKTKYSFTLSPIPVGKQATATYYSQSQQLKAYTLGYRNSQGNIGAYSFVNGYNNMAVGAYSHAEGHGTIAQAESSHAEGDGGNDILIAAGIASHAEGIQNVAIGDHSHVEGAYNRTDGENAHCEGVNSSASGEGSHAEGWACTASGDASHAQNIGTVAGYANQTAIGKYNNNKSTNAFEIGNGTSSARANIFEVDWSGNVVLAGGLTVASPTTSFSGTLGSGLSGSCNGIYDALSKTVRINFNVQKSTDIATSDVLFTIPSAYRPSAAVSGSGVVEAYVSSTYRTRAYEVTLNTSGQIKQGYSNYARSVFGVFEYSL